MRRKNFFGMPIPDRPLSREEAENLSESDLKEMGFETRFWPFYFRVFWSRAKFTFLALVIGLVLGCGATFFYGTDFEISPILRNALPVIGVALVAPVILIVVSYLWWHGSSAIDRLFGKNEQDH